MKVMLGLLMIVECILDLRWIYGFHEKVLVSSRLEWTGFRPPQELVLLCESVAG